MFVSLISDFFIRDLLLPSSGGIHLWFERTLLLFFVFVLKAFFCFYFRVLWSESRGGFDTLVETLGQQNGFQSQIGGNCDWKLFCRKTLSF